MFGTMSIVSLFYEGGALHLEVSLLSLLGLLGLLLFTRFGWRRWFGHRWDVVEVDFSFGGVGKAKLRRTDEVVRIAHQAWTELTTRKAALPFDMENDVVSEVYDSWYVLFGQLRELAKSVPAEQIRDGGPSKELVDILVQALNCGLRPHLTRWQARFATWERAAAGKEPDRSPQDLQRDYPEYEQLIDELVKVNDSLIGFAGQLNRIVTGKDLS